MSVGHVCDQGLHVAFDAKSAIIYDKDNNEICHFNRSENGLYICKMKLKRPRDFTRQGS